MTRRQRKKEPNAVQGKIQELDAEENNVVRVSGAAMKTLAREIERQNRMMSGGEADRGENRVKIELISNGPNENNDNADAMPEVKIFFPRPCFSQMLSDYKKDYFYWKDLQLHGSIRHAQKCHG